MYCIYLSVNHANKLLPAHWDDYLVRLGLWHCVKKIVSALAWKQGWANTSVCEYSWIYMYSYCIRPNIWNRIIFLFIFSLHPQFDSGLSRTGSVQISTKRLVAWVVWVALNCNGDVGQGSSQKNMILWKFFPNGSWTVKSISMCPSTLKGGYRKMFVFFHRFRWVQYMVEKSLKRLVRN